RTARDPVVSDTAERVPVHLPEQDGLAGPGGLPPRLPEVGPPGDGRPAVLARRGADDLAEGVEAVGGDRLGRRQGRGQGGQGEQRKQGSHGAARWRGGSGGKGILPPRRSCGHGGGRLTSSSRPSPGRRSPWRRAGAGG